VQVMLRPLTNHILIIGIPKPDNYFDYVHQRFLVSGMPVNKWKEHIQECARICASGGWVEIVEMNAQIVGGGPACQQFNTWTTGICKSRGSDLNMAQHLEELVHEAGLINVTKQVLTVPIGPWGGRAGELFAENFRLASNSVQPAVTSIFNVSKEEIERIAALMLEEFKSHQTHMLIHVYLGQKQ
jgi:ubiquinone/menaquinone biosynthesis C-methylase UbiE